MRALTVMRLAHRASAECTHHYDCVLKWLLKHYDIKHFSLDNNCLYMKHYLKYNKETALTFVVPMLHVGGHGLVRDVLEAAPRLLLT